MILLANKVDYLFCGGRVAQYLDVYVTLRDCAEAARTTRATVSPVMSDTAYTVMLFSIVSSPLLKERLDAFAEIDLSILFEILGMQVVHSVQGVRDVQELVLALAKVMEREQLYARGARLT